jgi:hypothetical protein
MCLKTNENNSWIEKVLKEVSTQADLNPIRAL